MPSDARRSGQEHARADSVLDEQPVCFPIVDRRALKILGLILALVNVSLWFSVPFLRNGFDAITGRLHAPHRPGFYFGVPELLVYYDPWLAYGVFPAVYTLGLLAIPLLFRPNRNPLAAGTGHVAVAILLLVLEAGWLFLIAFGILCRGPDWNFYWPWEDWDRKIVPQNPANFSEIFWWHIVGQRGSHSAVDTARWVIREGPGLLLAAGYLLLGLLVARSLSRGKGQAVASCSFVLVAIFALSPLSIRLLFSPDVEHLNLKLLFLLLLAALVVGGGYLLLRALRAWSGSQERNHSLPYWRSILFVWLVQTAALVPVKVLLWWTFDMKYFIDLRTYP